MKLSNTHTICLGCALIECRMFTDRSYMTIIFRFKEKMRDKSRHARSMCGMWEQSKYAGQSRKMRDGWQLQLGTKTIIQCDYCGFRCSGEAVSHPLLHWLPSHCELILSSHIANLWKSNELIAFDNLLLLYTARRLIRHCMFSVIRSFPEGRLWL